jgi:hypothetical protein
VASKPAAAYWGQKNLRAGRAALIQRALASQHDEDKISDTEFKETLDFLDDALKQIRPQPTKN